MRRWLGWLSVGLYLSAMGVVSAQSQIPSAPTTSIYVQDYAGVLSDETKGRINVLGRKLKAATKAQVVVVTVNTLEDTVPADYAREIIRQWGIGDKQLNNGVLLLLVVGERKSRIEVGYGLEGALPDAKTGQIQDEQLVPYLKKGNYDQGIWNTYQTLVSTAAKEYNVNIKGDKERSEKQTNTNSDTPLHWWVKILFVVGLVVLLLIDNIAFGGFFTGLILGLLLSGGGRKGGGDGGGNDGFGGGSSGGGGSDRGW